MSQTTMRELENDNSGAFVNNIADDLAGSGATYETEFSDFVSKGYAQCIDIILATRHGKKILLEDQLEHTDPEDPTTMTWAYMTVSGYLFERAPWIRQQMAYIAAEYNPIENYSQVERETLSMDRKRKQRDITNTEEPYERKRKIENPEIITEQYAETNIINETEQAQSTTEQQVAPFDSSTYSNQNKTVENPGKITNTEKPYNRKFKTPENEVDETEYLEEDKVVKQKIEDIAYIDQDRRELTRSGNIGVQTAAQMMMMDAEFWNNNRWLTQMAEDIVGLICEEVLYVS